MRRAVASFIIRMALCIAFAALMKWEIVPMLLIYAVISLAFVMYKWKQLF